MIMRILCAVDGSEYSYKAVDFLISKFDWFKETPELHLLYVHPAVPIGRATAVLGKAAIDNYYKEESEDVLLPLEDVLRKKAMPFTASYLVGEVAQQINLYTERHKIDMVVMGSHGHGSFKNLVLGSVATKVLSKSSVPVLLIH
jgi:nucleotide-binding universal stress UspA family protein